MPDGPSICLNMIVRNEAHIVHDTLVAPALADPQHAAHDALAHALRGRIATGSRVAITAGSRGIANVGHILRGLAQAVRDVGGEPFFIAAMGSHGGGTGLGQREMLAGLGITAISVGAPIVSEMDVVEVGTTAGGVRVYCDAQAARARRHCRSRPRETAHRFFRPD